MKQTIRFIASTALAAAALAWAEVEVIVFACTSGSFIHGLGWDRELIARIETASGTPATTTSTAVIAALGAVGASAVTLCTPYRDDINDIEAQYFAANGYPVVSASGLGLESPCNPSGPVAQTCVACDPGSWGQSGPGCRRANPPRTSEGPG